MSTQDQNQDENANSDDYILDLQVAMLERQRKYHAPGGLYEQLRERGENAYGDDDVRDLQVACLERMGKYYAPGGLYQQQ